MNKIDKIFNSYIGKKFSKSSVNLFGRWLITPAQKEEKESRLQTLWEETKATATDQTVHELYRLKAAVKPKLSFGWAHYAAAVVLIFISVSTTLIFDNVFPDTKVVVAAMCEEIAPLNQDRVITLSDGSEVWLNAGSVIIFPERFSENCRSIFLSGEARFLVAKDSTKRFIVNTHTLNVEALGTTFYLKSFADDSYASTTLEEGSIRVRIANNTIFNRVLQPGEELVYDKISDAIDVSMVNKNTINLRNEGYIIFQNSEFLDIINTIERRYNIEVYYDKSRFENSLYNIRFTPHETIENVMSVLKNVANIKYDIDNNKIHIY